MIFLPGFGFVSNAQAKMLLSMKDSTGLELGERIELSDDIARLTGYTRPPERGVQNGVQEGDENAETA